MVLAGAVTCAIGSAAVLRSGSRGGMLFLALAAAATIPLWRRPDRRRSWIWAVVLAAIVAVTAVLAATRLPAVRDRFSTLLVVEGVEGNTRWDLWLGTWRSWLRAPVPGSGLGSYRHVIGLDKPATGTSVLEQAHNDWLEWLSTSGILGFGVLAVAVAGLAVALRSRRLRSLRYEYRYPLAGAAFALLATALHETVGFGLQTPLNRYLAAAWVGVVWGVGGRRGQVPQLSADVGDRDGDGPDDHG
jgi:O-antigen ligase